MKKIMFLLIGMVAFMTSCDSAGDATKYIIDGTIKNGQNRTIYLEKLNMSKVTVIDTAQTDGSGHFRMSSAAEKGFYRLRVDNAHMWLMLLEDKSYKPELNYDNIMEYKISGTALNDEFEEGVKYVTESQIQLQNLKSGIQQQQGQGASMESLQKMSLALQQMEQTFEAEMKKRSDAAKDPLEALYYGSFLSIDKYPEENKKVIERLQKELPNSSYTAEMTESYNRVIQQIKMQEASRKMEAATAIGAEAPNLSFSSPDGKVLKLSELRGKVVLIDFWASWCGPCRRENPNVVAAYHKFKDKGFEIYSVSLDQDAGRWKDAIQQDGLTWRYHVSDLKGWQSEPAHMYGVQSIPAQFLLDKDGKIVAKNLRGEQLEQKLAELLK